MIRSLHAVIAHLKDTLSGGSRGLPAVEDFERQLVNRQVAGRSLRVWIETDLLPYNILSHAVALGAESIVLYLLKTVRLSPNPAQTVCHIEHCCPLLCVPPDKVAIGSTLLEFKADINCVCSCQETTLSKAVCHKYPIQYIQWLLKSGARVGANAILYAVHQHHDDEAGKEMLRLLLDWNQYNTQPTVNWLSFYSYDVRTTLALLQRGVQHYIPTFRDWTFVMVHRTSGMDMHQHYIDLVSTMLWYSPNAHCPVALRRLTGPCPQSVSQGIGCILHAWTKQEEAARFVSECVFLQENIGPDATKLVSEYVMPLTPCLSRW